MNFNEKVWQKLKKIPKGKVATYGQIAKAVRSPKAFRVVGNACNKNPDAPKTPCHRVVSSDGLLGGYAHGSVRKIRLLEREGIKVKNNRIVNFREVLVAQKELK